MLEQLGTYAVIAFLALVGLGVTWAWVKRRTPVVVKDALRTTGKLTGGALRVTGSVAGSVSGVLAEPRVPRSNASWICVGVAALVAASAHGTWWVPPGAALFAALVVAAAGTPTLVDIAYAQWQHLRHSAARWLGGMTVLVATQAVTFGVGLLLEAKPGWLLDVLRDVPMEHDLLVAGVAALQVVVTAAALGIRLRSVTIREVPLQWSTAELAFALGCPVDDVEKAHTRARVDRRTEEVVIAPLPRGVRGDGDGLDEAMSAARVAERVKQIRPGLVVREHTHTHLLASPRRPEEVAELRTLAESDGAFTGPVAGAPFGQTPTESVDLGATLTRFVLTGQTPTSEPSR